MELATAIHHSAQRVEGPREENVHGTNTALRRQKRLPRGKRPAPLAEAAGPQEVAATAGNVAARAPLFGVPSAAGLAVSYLLKVALRKKKEEEERRRRRRPPHNLLNLQLLHR